MGQLPTYYVYIISRLGGFSGSTKFQMFNNMLGFLELQLHHVYCGLGSYQIRQVENGVWLPLPYCHFLFVCLCVGPSKPLDLSKWSLRPSAQSILLLTCLELGPSIWGMFSLISSLFFLDILLYRGLAFSFWTLRG